MYYNTKDAIIAVVGLILGGFAAKQYCCYIGDFGKNALDSAVLSLKAWFSFGKKEEDDQSKVLLPFTYQNNGVKGIANKRH